jgi:redox-sensing transcriptional repressor
MSEEFHNTGGALPRAVRERLAHLARLLEGAEDAVVTSGAISRWTHWSRATVRKDIASLGASCGGPRGYDRRLLCAAIKQRLLPAGGPEIRACIVGLGSFGEMLLHYEGFAGSPVVVAAGFDQSVNSVETLTADFPLFPLSRLEEIVRRERIEYAVLATAEDAAQEAARRLIAAGVRGIVNVTRAALRLGADVCVELSIVAALENLSCRKEQEPVKKTGKK